MPRSASCPAPRGQLSCQPITVKLNTFASSFEARSALSDGVVLAASVLAANWFPSVCSILCTVVATAFPLDATTGGVVGGVDGGVLGGEVGGGSAGGVDGGVEGGVLGGVVGGVVGGVTGGVVGGVTGGVVGGVVGGVGGGAVVSTIVGNPLSPVPVDAPFTGLTPATVVTPVRLVPGTTPPLPVLPGEP